MFSRYCSNCQTRKHCFENGHCLREKFDADDNIADVSEVSDDFTELVDDDNPETDKPKRIKKRNKRRVQR